MEKGDKPKKKAGQKAKARLRIEGDVSICEGCPNQVEVYDWFNYF